ncbi:MAG TPA: zinc-dependent metalloprotease, partial [Burkholderiaceae bacterium]|nr:zinc-dependent metalloprotease [Burkholderiaceae bacterium]
MPSSPNRFEARPTALAALGLCAALLAGCATQATAPAKPTGAAAVPANGAANAAANGAANAAANGAVRPAAAPAGSAPTAGVGPSALPLPGQPPAFAVVTKDARKIDGLLTVWQKDDKFWVELGEKDFGAAFFLSPKVASGIGEGGVLGGLMASRWGSYGGPQQVEFRRVHNQVQLIARNTAFVARAGTPEARALAAGFSPSLLASTPVASAPHPERKTVLVEANGLFLGDLQGIAMALQQRYRQGYALDGRNTAITRVRGQRDELIVEVLSHFATASIALPQPGLPPGAPVPTQPQTLPDARSLFVGLQYSLTRLPEPAMAPRAADGRIGHFVTTTSDFSDDLARSPKLRHIARWRLEKKEPAAALSEPVKPITYWIDRNVPLKYRDAIRAGILEWNRAFEAVGFKNAIVVKQQPDDADFDTLDTGVASVRWMINASPSFGAIGPSHLDPRSGEILDADIAFESLSSRALRTLRSQLLPASATDWPALLQATEAQREAAASARGAAPAQAHPEACMHADQAAEQLGYALDILALRDGLDPAGPEAQAFVQAYMKDVTMHEVGHTLGLRHNFRASRVYSDRQVADPEFGKAHALTGSVMEYAPINLARPGQPEAVPFQTTLGPYDYWAIEYAYKPIAAADEAAELARIAARSAEPELAYGTDEDNYLGIDPESLHFDLGDDPVAFASRRFDIARDLFARLDQRPLAGARDYGLLRRVVGFALRDVGRAAGVLARQIGGL